MAARRMVQQDLVRAWEVWWEQWSEHATNRRMLAAAGARLMKPQLTAAFAHWRVDWAAEEEVAAAEAAAADVPPCAAPPPPAAEGAKRR